MRVAFFEGGMDMPGSVVRRWLVAVWIACAGLAAGGAPCYVIDLSGGPDAASYPMEMLADEPVDGWTAEHKTTKLALRRVEAGEFVMCNQTRVTLTRPFYIGVFEVTSRQYELVMGTTAGAGDARPEAGVGYNEIRGSSDWPNSSAVGADTFLGRLRARTGLATLDLPTEAQWEYACRAGTTNEYNNGGSTAEDLKLLGRYEGNGDDGRGEGDEYAVTTVGSYLPNAWGLYDMHGNVREWCLDYYDAVLAGGSDPAGGATGNWRVVRGGGYEDAARNCTASFRTSDNPANAAAQDGFRVVCFPAEIVCSASSYEGVYDGDGHGIAVAVTMPESAVTRYALSESGLYRAEPILFTNVTETAVTVWYKVEADGYETVTGSETVAIGKATYDMSGVAWDYAGPFEGDGAVKTVALVNLPMGVTAAYTGNMAAEPGTYEAHAVLAYDATNYEAPVVADLEWTITEPVDLAVDLIVGYPVTIGSNGAGAVEGIADPSATRLRSVRLTTSDSHEAWFEVVVTNALSVSFDWKCSCEELPKKREPYDYLKFSIDGTRLAYIGGETDWTNVTFPLAGTGVQTLRWTYVKDEEDFAGDDCGWVANVVITFPRKIFFIRIQ